MNVENVNEGEELNKVCYNHTSVVVESKGIISEAINAAEQIASYVFGTKNQGTIGSIFAFIRRTFGF